MAKDSAPIITAESILDHFESLPDPRSHVNRKHLLGDLIVISIMAVIAGAEGPEAISVWAKSNKDWLAQRLQLPSGVPSADTIVRLLVALKPSACQQCFEGWIKALSEKHLDQDLDVIAIDYGLRH